MQSATRVLGVLDIPAQDGLDGPQRPAGHGRRCLVHARERRAIAALADAGLREAERIRGLPWWRWRLASRVGAVDFSSGQAIMHRS
jgi:hypothetical protein